MSGSSPGVAAVFGNKFGLKVAQVRALPRDKDKVLSDEALDRPSAIQVLCGTVTGATLPGCFVDDLARDQGAKS